jgi:hypothetical protein
MYNEEREAASEERMGWIGNFDLFGENCLI